MMRQRTVRNDEVIESVTPPLRILFVPAWPVPAAVWQLAAMLFCVANKLGVACA